MIGLLSAEITEVQDMKFDTSEPTDFQWDHVHKIWTFWPISSLMWFLNLAFVAECSEFENITDVFKSYV